MNIYVRLLVIIVIIYQMLNYNVHALDIEFTEEERERIENAPQVIVGIDPQFSPYEFIDSDGVYKGIVPDYLELIESKTGLKFQIQDDLTWVEAYNLAREGKIEMLSCVGVTQQREQYFLFSDIYLTYQRVLLSRVDGMNYTVDNLKNSIVGTQKSSSHYSYLLSNLNIEPILYDDNEALISALSYGEIDVVVADYASSRYQIKALGITNIKVDEVIDDNINEFAMAINLDNKVLVSIINKGLLQITEEEKIQIRNKWLGIEQRPDYSRIRRGITIGIAVIVVFFAIFSYWTMKLKKEINRRKIVEEQLVIAKKEAEAANRAKSVFLANMSHEIRTPLNAIVGLVYLLDKTKTSFIQKNYISNIKNSSFILTNTINDILDYSKIESGQIVLENIEFNIDQILAEVSNMLMPKATEKGIQFHIKKSMDMPSVFLGDPIRIEKILINLVNNAIKFTEVGEVQIDLSVIRKVKEISIIKCSVSDTGMGMTPEQIEQLFIPFHQLDSSITRKYGGTGLGLSISYNFARLLKGRIEVQSVKGQGSTFSLIIPLNMNTDREEANDGQELSGYKVLIVEKNNEDRRNMVEYLKHYKMVLHESTSYSDGKKLLEREEEGYNLVIIGIEREEEIRKLMKAIDMERTTVILLAKHMSESQYELYEKLGINHIMLKPIITSMLLDEIISCIHGKTQNEKIENAQAQKFFSATILLVEDEQINQLIEKEILEQRGFEVLVANNGAEAYEIMGLNRTIDLVLMDIQMPVMNGYEATKKIKERYNGISVIAMTAMSYQDIKSLIKEADIDGYINKPINHKELFAEIEKYIKPTEMNQRAENKKEAEGKGEALLLEDRENEYLDTQQGLARIENNTGLYLEVIMRFYEDIYDKEGYLTELLQKKDLAKISGMAHKIGGVAGNVGAIGLYKSSIKLMKAVEEEWGEIEQYVLNFEVDLSTTINILAQISHQNKGVITRYNGIVEKVGYSKKLMKEIKSLKKLLHNSDLDAFKIISEIEDEAIKIDPKWQEIIQAINNYQFLHAEALIEDIDF